MGKAALLLPVIKDNEEEGATCGERKSQQARYHVSLMLQCTKKPCSRGTFKG